MATAPAPSPAPFTPGGYLRRRREAARLSIEDAADRFLLVPRPNPMVSYLEEIEADKTAPAASDLVRLRSAFPFDLNVYQLLARGVAAEDVEICVRCACTWYDACVDNGCGCFWAEPGLCSACVGQEPLA